MRIFIVGVIIVGILYAFSTFLQHKNLPATQLEKVTPKDSKANSLYDHVVVIVMENKSYKSIVGNEKDAPYINSLIKNYSLATNYFAINHPSLPNYLDLVGGTHGSINNDCNPPGGTCSLDTKSIADTLEESGNSWKGYMESMPKNCGLSNTDLYADKHNPFIYFENIRNNKPRCEKHIVPLTSLLNDFNSLDSTPTYSFISPDLCSDTHDCSILTGDQWLEKYVSLILKSPSFTQKKSLLILTWDEDDGSRDNHIATIFVGNGVKKGYQSAVRYDHYSLLHTIEEVLKLTPINTNDATASVMNDMFE